MSNDLTPENLPKQDAPQQRMENEVREEEQAAEFALTEDEAQRAMAFLREEQNLLMGVIYGLFAALAGAAVWAGVTIATDFKIGWMAVGIGFLVGIAVRAGGKGIDQVFGVAGAVLSLVGCALGNLLTVAWFVSQEYGVPVGEVLSGLDLESAIELMSATFELTDVLFYGLAVYFGYRYAFRELGADDFNRALGRAM
ncbi:MAG: hypothetical protein QNI96_00250 [Woeseiaceae bacterium]|nr:hypothetical protein [Woeseiaceae bacterium]